MVNEAGDPALIGVEFGGINNAAQALHGYTKVSIGPDELEDIGVQLEFLVSEVNPENLGDKENADKLADEIRKHFSNILNQPLNLKVDLEKDPKEKYSGREDVREIIDQLAALALKYSEFNIGIDQKDEADESEHTEDAAAA